MPGGSAGEGSAEAERSTGTPGSLLSRSASGLRASSSLYRDAIEQFKE